LQEIKEMYEAPYLPEMETDESIRLNAVINELRRRNPSGFQPLIITYGTNATENLTMKSLLVEDHTASELGYTDYVSHLHNVISERLGGFARK
jgi:hypothetical protein